MRRLVFPTIVALGLVMVGSSSAFAEDPTPAPTVSAKSTPGKKLCKIAGTDLTELSGLVAVKNGYVAINDGAADGSEAKERVFFLDRECKVTEKVAFSGGGPLDPEDIVLSADGETLWIADTGDNGVRESPPDPRSSVVLWSMPADGSQKPKLHRLSYPSGDVHDAEALLLNGDGTPLIVTKEIGKATAIYQPTAALKTNNSTGVPMKRVGEITLSATETAGNRVARIGNKTVTGGAIAPGGGKVALRTYTDALEWDVTGGDVLAALKKTPRTTGLPNEPFGEAIAYSSDGKTFLTASDMSGDTATANHIRQYTPADKVAEKSAKQGGGTTSTPWYLSVDNLTYAVGGVGLLGLVLVGAGIFGIVRFRKSPQAIGPLDDDPPSGFGGKGDPETELIGVGGAPQRGAAYGSGRPGGGGPVYGAKSGPPAGGAKSGPPAGGPQYGRPGGQQQGAPRNPPQQPPRGPQQQPARGPQQQPPRGPQQQPPARAPQQQPPRGPQQAPGRGQQPPPGRGPGQVPPRNPQQPPRGPQQQPPGRGPQPPARGGGGGVYGGQQPPRGPQQPGPGMYGGGRPQGPGNR